MIVKMKKVYLVVLDSIREKSLIKLRDIGVAHIEREYKSNETVNSLIEKHSLFERSILALPQLKKYSDNIKYTNLDEAEKLAERISVIQERVRSIDDEIEKERKNIISLAPWGDFDPSDVKDLDGKGIVLKFYELTKEQFANLPADLKYIKVNSIKNKTFITAVSLSDEKLPEIDAEEYSLPSGGIKTLTKSIEKNSEEKIKLEKELLKLAEKKVLLTEGIKELDTILEFESVNADMNVEERFAYISGYVPTDRVEKLKSAAAEMHWALLIRDPEKNEDPPTLVRNPKWVSIIQPLFKFLDIAPGYRELDISMFFLTFFTVFVAMIIGDAGYGIIFLGMTLLMRLKMKKAPSQIFFLLSILSGATIVWGVITGTWFGAKTFAEIPVLKALIIPEIASFGHGDTTDMIIQLSFLIGMVHLTLGLLISFIRKMPSLAAIAELGWLLILYAMYFVARFFVLGVELNLVALPLFLAGFAVVLLFAEQDGKNIFKGILMGIAWSPMKFLNSVNMFADLVSYIRLFAVGLATVAVAQSFNQMASGFEGVVGMILAAVVLFLAHTFNMAMSLLSVIVHGVRLNLLEFGGKVGMEWSGHNYNPFKKNEF
ncbi:MAG: V-type ATP synthase subunit I [Spirochaetia bacterium]|jgi:V/A-type H+-transporting ATPase subunit I|nr:V-type ATP synthase subunit I [Spirochaetia bacterium]